MQNKTENLTSLGSLEPLTEKIETEPTNQLTVTPKQPEKQETPVSENNSQIKTEQKDDWEDIDTGGSAGNVGSDGGDGGGDPETQQPQPIPQPAPQPALQPASQPVPQPSDFDW